VEQQVPPHSSALKKCIVAQMLELSSFTTRAKKTAWDTWRVLEEAIATFLVLSTGPSPVNDADGATLEKSMISLYDRTSSFVHIDEIRKPLFSKKRHIIDAIPPTRAVRYSLLKGLCTKEGIAGVRYFKLFLAFLFQRTGKGLISVTQHLYGQLSQILALWLQERVQRTMQVQMFCITTQHIT